MHSLDLLKSLSFHLLILSKTETGLESILPEVYLALIAQLGKVSAAQRAIFPALTVKQKYKKN